MPPMIRLADFTAVLNQPFTLPLTDQTLQLTLKEAVDLGYGTDTDQSRRAFSLLFRQERQDAYLPQGTYALQNSALGELHLFLVPLGPQQDGIYYEAVFT